MTVRIVLVALVVFVFCGAAPIAQDQALIDKGQKLYATNKCQNCHSIAGKGNKKGPLDEVGSKLSAEEIRQWLINPVEMTAKTKSTRKPPMTSYAKLSKDDVEALVAYMQSLKKQ